MYSMLPDKHYDGIYFQAHMRESLAIHLFCNLVWQCPVAVGVSPSHIFVDGAYSHRCWKSWSWVQFDVWWSDLTLWTDIWHTRKHAEYTLDMSGLCQSVWRSNRRTRCNVFHVAFCSDKTLYWRWARSREKLEYSETDTWYICRSPLPKPDQAQATDPKGVFNTRRSLTHTSVCMYV